jgi:hypothetical protein
MRKIKWKTSYKVLFHKIKELSFNWWTDKLNCSESWCRKKMNIKLEEALALFDESQEIYVSLLTRRGYSVENENYLEFTASTIPDYSQSSTEYFIWFEINMNNKLELFKNLKEYELYDAMREENET